MKNLIFILSIICLPAMVLAQDIIFDEEIEIPAGWTPTEFVMPPSPLSVQVLFVGGHDIVQTTPTYGNPAGRAVAKEWHDFIGWTPDFSGESMGWVTVNHEQIYEDDRIGDGGGMTAFRVRRAASDEIEVMEQTLEDGRTGEFFNVDFVNTVGETGMNCGGIVGANGRIWTAEEWFRTSNTSIWNGNFRPASRPDSWNPHSPAPSAGGYGVRDTSDFTIDAPEFPLVNGMTIPKYQNFNYMTEIDPRQAKAIRKQYNWGRAGWEGGAISADGKYVYLGIDGVPAPWVRFEAETPFNFNEGTLAVYKHDNAEGERWIEVPETVDNMLGGLTDYAWAVGATMFMRNEWVCIDERTGVVYWTETGRDSGSSGPGIVFNALTSATNAVTAPHHEAWARELGNESATDVNYQDYYGRVLYYDPSNEEIGVVINGGPFLEESPAEGDYPSKHLSNPDGLSILTIDNTSFLLIQEDLNGTSFGRTPEGVSNRVCELYVLQADKRDADVNELVRITAIPAGAEITGAIQIDPNTILVNSQHPNANNPFPYNHSLTAAIHGFERVTTSSFDHPVFEEGTELTLFPNPTTREIFLSKTGDFAIYSVDGKRIAVYRNTNQADVSHLAPGQYFIKLDTEEVVSFIVE
jgi:secreted PhoX family phosphatase